MTIQLKVMISSPLKMVLMQIMTFIGRLIKVMITLLELLILVILNRMRILLPKGITLGNLLIFRVKPALNLTARKSIHCLLTGMNLLI